MTARADKAMRDIWSAFHDFYTAHFRAPGIGLSYADQMAFMEIAQPILHELVKEDKDMAATVKELRNRLQKFRAMRLGAMTLSDVGALVNDMEEAVRMLEMRPPVMDQYQFNTDFPAGDVKFLGLYRVEGKYRELIIYRSRERMENLQFITEDGGPPHYVGDPIAWAHLPVVPEPLPVEHIVARAEGTKWPDATMRRLELQAKEFETLDALVSALRNLPAVVDDDYPQMRHQYDSALRDFLRACKANGRLEQIGIRKE